MSIEFDLDAELKANLAAMQRLRSVEVTVGTDLVDPPYPYFLEFGTSRMSARPSARPAFEESKGQAISVVASTLAAQFQTKRFTQASMRVAGDAGGEEIRNRWAQLAPVDTGTYRRGIHVETRDLR